MTLSRKGNVVSVEGEVDFNDSTDFKAIVTDCVEEHGSIVFDMANLTFIDSSGIAVIVMAYRKTGPGLVRIRNAPPMVERVLRLTNLDKLVEVE